eukprot:jgi/Antlo1/918/2434
MIESPAIKRFIVLHFLENPTDTVFDMVRSIHSHLKSKFVADEIVFVKSRGIYAKVQGSVGDTYILKILAKHEIDSVEVSSGDIMRKDHLTKSCILKFLENITKDSPFGRVLRKNVLQDMSVFTKQRENGTRTSRGRRKQSKDTVFSNQDAVCLGDNYVQRRPSKSSKAYTNDNVESFECDRNSDSDTKLVSHSEEITTAKRTGYEKGNRMMQREAMISLTENDESSTADYTKPAELHVKDSFTSLGDVIDSLNCVTVEIKGIRDMETFIEVCLLFSYFRKYFNIELSKEDFAEALLDRNYTSEIAFRLHKALLDTLSRELRAVGREQFKQFVECAIDVCVPEDGVFDSKPLQEKYDWCDTGINEHNWKDVMRSFCSQIYHVYGLHSIVFYKEFTTGIADDIVADRLGLLKFLIECIYCTDTFRQVVDTRVEKIHQNDRNRHDTVSKRKKARGGISDSESLESAADEGVSSSKKGTVFAGQMMIGKRYRADIANIDGMQFVFFEENVCFWKDREFYMMSAEQLNLLKVYVSQCRQYSPFSALLKNYFFSFPRNAPNTSKMYLSDRESM